MHFCTATPRYPLKMPGSRSGNGSGSDTDAAHSKRVGLVGIAVAGPYSC